MQTVHLQVKDSEESMIVVLSYYPDGSWIPSLHFFPRSTDDSQACDVAAYIASETEQLKMIEVYRITAIDDQAHQVYPLVEISRRSETTGA